MPRRTRRTTRRYRRGSSAAPLVALLLLALLLLVLIENGRTINLPLPVLDLPDLPDISIPITGLPRVEIPEVELKLPFTVVPGTLIPDIRIAGTPAPDGTPAPPGAFVPAEPSKSSDCRIQGSLPDPACTPGGVLTGSAEQVCTPGYAGSVRDVPQAQKEAIYDAYGITSRAPGQYQVDHLIPLSLGGSNENANLWPQPGTPRPGYEEKNALARYLHGEVCDGDMTLSEAQRRIATDWVAAYNDMPK